MLVGDAAHGLYDGLDIGLRLGAEDVLLLLGYLTGRGADAE